MSSSKKRKLDGEVPVLSAFAALQKLKAVGEAQSGDSPKLAATVDGGNNDSTEKGDHHAKDSRVSRKGRRPLSTPQTPNSLACHGENDGVTYNSPLNALQEPKLDGEHQDPVTPNDQPMPKVIVQHSTFRPNKAFKNFQRKANGKVIVKLLEGERLVILGSYSLTVDKGVVTIAGSTLNQGSGPHLVHAPLCYALPVIRCPEDSAVLEFEDHPHSASLRLLERLNPLFGRLWDEAAEHSTDSFRIVYTSEDSPKRANLWDLVPPAEWNKKLAEFSSLKQRSAPVVLICGPKSSGKSTFGRLLTNGLVTTRQNSKSRRWPGVAVLDLDPGQPEYTPPGVISLSIISEPTLSPPFCHVGQEPGRVQVKAHTLACVTPALDPDHYVECCLDLFLAYCEQGYGKYPLVINTPGWIQGTGLDMLAELVKKTQPSEVLYMSQDGPEETTDILRAACGSCSYSELPSQAGDSGTTTALHFRTMQMMSYFHVKWNRTACLPSTWHTRPLTTMAPWLVSYRGQKRGFLGLLFYDHQPPMDLLTESINGTVLAVVRVDAKLGLRGLARQETLAVTAGLENLSSSQMDLDENAARDQERLMDVLPIDRGTCGIPVIPNSPGTTLDPKYSRTLCLVLVRGIDTERGELQLLTPFPGETLSNDGSNLVLVSGKFDTPTWAYTEALYSRAYDEANGEDGPRQSTQMREDKTDGELSSEGAGEHGLPYGDTEIPWVEVLQGNQGRTVGSKVLRVRRDLKSHRN